MKIKNVVFESGTGETRFQAKVSVELWRVLQDTGTLSLQESAPFVPAVLAVMPEVNVSSGDTNGDEIEEWLKVGLCLEEGDVLTMQTSLCDRYCTVTKATRIAERVAVLIAEEVKKLRDLQHRIKALKSVKA